MPSTMIHLLIAHELYPNAEDLFWVGNFAPDYTNDRALKDSIHLRNSSNRLEALNQLKSTIDIKNPFEAGWLLHLFVDTCWDTEIIPIFQEKYKDKCAQQHWFAQYREEIGLASYYLYHHMDWVPHIWSQIKNAQLSFISTILPVSPKEIQWYRDRVCQKHRESNKESVSIEYNREMLLKYARETVYKYKKWL